MKRWCKQKNIVTDNISYIQQHNQNHHIRSYFFFLFIVSCNYLRRDECIRVAPESGSGQYPAFFPNPAKIRLRAKFRWSRMLLSDVKMRTSNANSIFRTKIPGVSHCSLFCFCLLYTSPSPRD